MLAMNLLNYPALDRQRRRWHRWWTSLAGGSVGVLMAWAGAQWLAAHGVQLQQEQQRLNALLGLQKQATQSLQKQQVQQANRQQQGLHMQRVADQHAAWETLHRALQREAVQGGVQLVSLQQSEDRLVLHGRANTLHDMNRARERLSQALGWALDLSSAQFTTQSDKPGSSPARSAGGETLEFVWQANWPVMRAGAEKKSGAPLNVPTQKVTP